MLEIHVEGELLDRKRGRTPALPYEPPLGGEPHERSESHEARSAEPICL
jgi:hypothetical protein